MKNWIRQNWAAIIGYSTYIGIYWFGNQNSTLDVVFLAILTIAYATTAIVSGLLGVLYFQLHSERKDAIDDIAKQMKAHTTAESESTIKMLKANKATLTTKGWVIKFLAVTMVIVCLSHAGWYGMMYAYLIITTPGIVMAYVMQKLLNELYETAAKKAAAEGKAESYRKWLVN